MSKTKNPNTLKQMNKRQTEMMAVMDKKINELDQKLTDKCSENYGLCVNIEKLERENNNVLNMFKGVSADLRLVRKDHQDHLEAFRNERTHLQTKISNLFLDNARLQAQINSQNNGCNLTPKPSN